MERGPRPALRPALAWIARAIVGIALVVAGTTKAVHPGTFLADLWTYRLLSQDTAYWVAAFLPWLEIVAGLALVTGRQLAGARLLAALLLLAFLVALVAAWTRGLEIACGCFGAGPGPEGPTPYPWLVGRDLLLLGCLAADVWLGGRRRGQVAGAEPR